MIRTAYGVSLLAVAVLAAYAFGAIHGGVAGYGAGLRPEPPHASELILLALGQPPGLSLVLVLMSLLGAVGSAILFKAVGHRRVVDLIIGSRAAVVEALSQEEAALSPLEVVLGTVAAFAAACCGLVICGLVESWAAETVAVLSCLAGLETLFGLVLVVMVIIQRPRSVAVFVAATVAVLLEVVLIASMILASTA